MKHRLMGLALLLLTSHSTLALSAESFETKKIPGGSFTLKKEGFHAVRLGDGWRHVKKIYISAEALVQDAMVDVIANGEVRATLYVPARDPNYEVPIKEAIQSLEFRHRSGGEVRFFEIQVVQSNDPIDEVSSVDKPSLRLADPPRTAEELSRRVIGLVDNLRPELNAETEYAAYLLPVKTVAGRSLAIAKVYGHHSKTRAAMLALVRQIDYAEPVIHDLMKRENTFDRAVIFLALKVWIIRYLE